MELELKTAVYSCKNSFIRKDRKHIKFEFSFREINEISLLQRLNVIYMEALTLKFLELNKPLLRQTCKNFKVSKTAA